MANNIPSSKIDTFIFYALISLLAGLILNVMPCVFPILSIKLLSVFTTERATAKLVF